MPAQSWVIGRVMKSWPTHRWCKMVALPLCSIVSLLPDAAEPQDIARHR